MNREEPLVRFDRPDEDDIEIIRNPAGAIISARKTDHSVLGYLLKIDAADHGHEAAINTYLDWRNAHQCACGARITRYDDISTGPSESGKASDYLALIRRLGSGTRKLIDLIASNEPVPFTEKELFALQHIHLDALNKLRNGIKDVVETREESLARDGETS